MHNNPAPLDPAQVLLVMDLNGYNEPVLSDMYLPGIKWIYNDSEIGARVCDADG